MIYIVRRSLQELERFHRNQAGGIHLLPPLFKQVIDVGKQYGPPTSQTFYPSSGGGGPAADGNVLRSVSLDSWSDIHNGAGTTVNVTLTYLGTAIQSHSTPNTWFSIYRGFASFNTAAIPAGSQITSATLSLYTYSVFNNMGGSPALGVVAFNSSNPGNPPTSDYGNFGTTLLAPTIPWSSLADGTWSTFTLNDAGKAAIMAAGITSLGLREATYDVANTPPPWGNTRNIGYYARSVEIGGAYRPYLSVTWQPPL